MLLVGLSYRLLQIGFVGVDGRGYPVGSIGYRVQVFTCRRRGGTVSGEGIGVGQDDG